MSTGRLGAGDTAIQPTILDAKGDLIVATAADTPARLAVGSNDTVLIADSSTATGLKWGTVGASTATPTVSGTVFGKTTTTATSPVGIGYQALENSTGFNSVAIGYRALRASTGGNNVAINNNALIAATSGEYNTAIGSNVLEVLTTGNNNTAVGYYSQVAHNGSDNVSIGSYAMETTTGTLQGCTAIGKGALNGVTGSNNTAVGRDAGRDVTSGANNTLIGNNAQPASATASNVITLGNSSIATLRCQVTSITALSDQRDKTNINNIPVGLSFIKDLRPIVFEWKTRPEFDRDGNIITNANDGKLEGGFLAQELLAVEEKYNTRDWTKIVSDENPEKLEAAPGKLIPILVKAIQELSEKVEQLEKQLGGN